MCASPIHPCTHPPARLDEILPPPCTCTEVKHCTAVPSEETDLFSVWSSVHDQTKRQWDADEAGKEELRRRCTLGNHDECAFEEGEIVSAYWIDEGQPAARFWDAEVLKVEEDGGLQLKSLSNGKVWDVEPREVHNYVVKKSAEPSA